MRDPESDQHVGMVLEHPARFQMSCPNGRASQRVLVIPVLAQSNEHVFSN